MCAAKSRVYRTQRTFGEKADTALHARETHVSIEAVSQGLPRHARACTHRLHPQHLLTAEPPLLARRSTPCVFCTSQSPQPAPAGMGRDAGETFGADNPATGWWWVDVCARGGGMCRWPPPLPSNSTSLLPLPPRSMPSPFQRPCHSLPAAAAAAWQGRTTHLPGIRKAATLCTTRCNRFLPRGKALTYMDGRARCMSLCARTGRRVRRRVRYGHTHTRTRTRLGQCGQNEHEGCSTDSPCGQNTLLTAGARPSASPPPAGVLPRTGCWRPQRAARRPDFHRFQWAWRAGWTAA